MQGKRINSFFLRRPPMTLPDAPHFARRDFLAKTSLCLLGASLPVSVFAAPAQDLSRVVCIGGAITEILYALGQQNRIVAVDTTSQFPPAALKEKRSLGYMRAVSAEDRKSTRLNSSH